MYTSLLEGIRKHPFMDVISLKKMAYAFMAAAGKEMTVELARHILQVEPDVDREGVEDAFRRLERIHHPYASGGSKERFKWLLEAKKRLLEELPLDGVLEEPVEEFREPEELIGEVEEPGGKAWGDWYK